jgi:hypothetical protein
MKKLLYLLLPLHIIVLLLSPRFGWSIHDENAAVLTYKGVSYKDGALHSLYESQDDVVDISYANPFSKKFTITVNDTSEYRMEVKLDGESIESEPNMLPGIANDIVWKDTYGIIFWRCILAIGMTLISMNVFKIGSDKEGTSRKIFYLGAIIIYIFTILISLRIIF